jgi:hypothetical protein
VAIGGAGELIEVAGRGRVPVDKPTSAKVSRAVPAGSDTLVFAGVPDRGARLTTGTYRLSVTATNNAGQTSNTLTAKFTIVR